MEIYTHILSCDYMSRYRDSRNWCNIKAILHSRSC